MGDCLIYVDGIPELVDENNVSAYYKKKNIHRDSTEGPAVCLSTGSEHYFENGELHRLDGPAVINSDGKKEYWIKGTQYSKKEWEKYISRLGED